MKELEELIKRLEVKKKAHKEAGELLQAIIIGNAIIVAYDIIIEQQTKTS